MSSGGQRDRTQRQLMAPRAQDRPDVLFAQEFVRYATHVHEVLRRSTGAAQQSEHRLHEEPAGGDALVHEVLEVVQVRRVIALELEPRAVLRASREDRLDVGEGVLEDEVPAVLQVIALPLVLELCAIA